MAEALEDGPAVEPWEHDVEHEGVVVPALGFVQAVLAVRGRIHRIPFLAQRLGQAREQVGFVFDDQDSHALFAGKTTRSSPALDSPELAKAQP